MITLPATQVDIFERLAMEQTEAVHPELSDPPPIPRKIIASSRATVSIQTDNKHDSGLPVRDFFLYFCADLSEEQINNLEVLYMNDKEFVLGINSVHYPVSLNQIQQVTPDCVCIHFTTVSHHERGRLPWHLRLMGAFLPRTWLPKPGALLTV